VEGGKRKRGVRGLSRLSMLPWIDTTVLPVPMANREEEGWEAMDGWEKGATRVWPAFVRAQEGGLYVEDRSTLHRPQPSPSLQLPSRT